MSNGVSLQQFAAAHNVTVEQLVELNPQLKGTETVPIGQIVYTSGENFEYAGLTVTKEDVKENQDGFKTSAKTKKQVAEIRNKYAHKFIAACGDNQELKAIAFQFINELPKSSRHRDLDEFKTACETKYQEFIAKTTEINSSDVTCDTGMSSDNIVIGQKPDMTDNNLASDNTGMPSDDVTADVTIDSEEGLPWIEVVGKGDGVREALADGTFNGGTLDGAEVIGQKPDMADINLQANNNPDKLQNDV